MASSPWSACSGSSPRPRPPCSLTRPTASNGSSDAETGRPAGCQILVDTKPLEWRLVMTRPQWISSAVSLASVALLLWTVPVHAQGGGLTLVPNTINMFRDTRGPNDVVGGGTDVFQYGGHVQGGSTGSTLGATYPPTGFVQTQAACVPIAVSADFCARTTPFNAGRIDAPWILHFVRGEEQINVSGPDLTIHDRASLDPGAIPDRLRVHAGRDSADSDHRLDHSRGVRRGRSESPDLRQGRPAGERHRQHDSQCRCLAHGHQLFRPGCPQLGPDVERGGQLCLQYPGRRDAGPRPVHEQQCPDPEAVVGVLRFQSPTADRHRDRDAEFPAAKHRRRHHHRHQFRDRAPAPTSARARAPMP